MEDPDEPEASFEFLPELPSPFSRVSGIRAASALFFFHFPVSSSLAPFQPPPPSPPPFLNISNFHPLESWNRFQEWNGIINTATIR